jgi:hypothetical protein
MNDGQFIIRAMMMTRMMDETNTQELHQPMRTYGTLERFDLLEAGQPAEQD